MEAVLEECGATAVSFFLGDKEAEVESPGLEDRTQHGSCQIQTPVQVHSTAGAGSEDSCEVEESITLNPEEETVPSDTEEQPDHLGEGENISLPDLDFRDGDTKSPDEKQVLGINDGLEVKISEEEKPPEMIEETSVKPPEINDDGAPQLDRSEDTQMDQKQLADEQDEDEYEDGRSVLSSNESIIKVSDEESICEEVGDFTQHDKCYVSTSGEELPLWSADDSIRNIMDVHLNGRPREAEHGSTPLHKTDIRDFGESIITNSAPTGGDRNEHSDFSILETSCSPGNS